jgi:UDP-glucose 4-epimerase
MGTCLVTGGAGFIGGHLVEALLARGHRVRVLDDLSTGSADNLRDVRDRIDMIEGDIRDPATVGEAVRGAEVVFHQAALPSVPRSIADPLSTHEVCATGTLRVLLAARDAGVRRVVYAASSSAYGNLPGLPRRVTDPTQPRSPYAVAKLTGEHYCVAFSDVYGLETVRLRYFNVYGPRQSPDSPYAAVIPKFLRAMQAGRSPTIHGDGEQSRDFTYIDDVVQANLLAADAPGVSGKVYNLACGRRTSLLELVARINALLGTDIRPVHEAPRPGDVRHSQADISAAKADFGYAPHVGIDEGLRRCRDWYSAGG